MALVLVACGHREGAGSPAVSDEPVSIGSASGVDQLALRIPRAGGAVRAFAYPDLDSLVWTSSDHVPATDRLLGFDAEGASLVALDARGTVYRVDLRLGTLTRDGPAHLAHAASVDGRAVFGVSPKGAVLRLTPEEQWSFALPAAPRAVIPEPNGSVLVLTDRHDSTRIWKLHPPDSIVADSAMVSRPTYIAATPVGDRLYLAERRHVVGIRTRDLQRGRRIDAEHPVRSIVTTPSGDRIYIATDSARELMVVDRYTNAVTTRIHLPGLARALRMDPSGHYLFARPAAHDSVWVIDIGTDHLVGSVATGWRSDLPAVAPDGALVLLRAPDVVFVRPPRMTVARTVHSGASDLWSFVGWNGFRPRDASLDQPVTFEGVNTAPDTATGDSALAGGDSVSRVPADTVASTRSPHDSVAAAALPASGFFVQFAALRSQEMARQTAAAIRIAGSAPRVESTVVAGVPIYRVVAGPFASREAADQAARATNHTYWIYQGGP